MNFAPGDMITRYETYHPYVWRDDKGYLHGFAPDIEDNDFPCLVIASFNYVGHKDLNSCLVMTARRAISWIFSRGWNLA